MLAHKPEYKSKAGQSRTGGARITLLAVALALFLGACSSGIDAPTPELETTAVSQSVWHQRLKASLSSPSYTSYTRWMDPSRIAASGDLFKLGRDGNNYVTSIILAYRETGDKALVGHLDKFMNIAKSKLRDTNGDGFINWRWLTRTDSGSGPYLGKDTHVMDEMLTHSMVAAAAYTFKQAGYSSSASYWTNYLKNHFEKKWRKRNGKPSGFPFIKHQLMHPTANFIRYNYYMSKLTGDSSYYREASRLAGTVKGTMRSSGSGYVWAHFVGRRSGCQPTMYAKYTSHALVDLASANAGFFDSSFMRKIAHTMAYKVLRNSSGTAMASNVCGGGSFGSAYSFVQYPFGASAAWDGSGRLRTAVERAYAATERYNTSDPNAYGGPAVMVFTLGR